MSLSKISVFWIMAAGFSLLLSGCSTPRQSHSSAPVEQTTHKTESPTSTQSNKKPQKSHNKQQDKESGPTQIYLDPNPSAGSARAMPGVNLHLRVNDLRAQRFLLSIHTEGKEQAELITSANNVRQAIYKAVKTNLEDRGIKLSDNAPNDLTIDIVALRSKAEQKTLNYVAIDQVILKATFKSEHRKVVRQYTASRRSTGSLKVDVSQQQNQLNQTLNAVLTGLLTDHKLLDQDNS